jgi:hypothetical protein
VTVKEHYDNHLRNFYSWMVGNFDAKQKEQIHFFETYNIKPNSSKVAIDLGAGHGFLTGWLIGCTSLG